MGMSHVNAVAKHEHKVLALRSSVLIHGATALGWLIATNCTALVIFHWQCD